MSVWPTFPRRRGSVIKSTWLRLVVAFIFVPFLAVRTGLRVSKLDNWAYKAICLVLFVLCLYISFRCWSWWIRFCSNRLTPTLRSWDTYLRSLHSIVLTAIAITNVVMNVLVCMRLFGIPSDQASTNGNGQVPSNNSAGDVAWCLGITDTVTIINLVATFGCLVWDTVTAFSERKNSSALSTSLESNEQAVAVEGESHVLH